VHGGGFYHNAKYLTGPRGEALTPNLHWFYWEAYSTWLSGAAMLAIVYWAGASSFLIDKSVLDMSVSAAIGLSFASLVAGWLGYDALCRLFGARPAALWTAVVLFLLASDFALFHIFGARAAYIHVGAMIGTIMVANVLFVIIPGQKRVVAQLRAGKAPDPRPGALGKIRSVHNTYLTLPVLFIMISNHYPMTYAGPYGWLVLAFIALAGVLVRRFYILTHTKRYVPALPIAASLVLVAVAIVFASSLPAVPARPRRTSRSFASRRSSRDAARYAMQRSRRNPATHRHPWASCSTRRNVSLRPPDASASKPSRATRCRWATSPA